MVTLLASSLKLNRRFPGPSESQKSGQTRLSPSCPTCLGLAVTQRLTASREIRPFVTSWIIHEPPNIFRQGNPGPPKARKYYKSKSRSLLGNYVEPAGKGRPQNWRWHSSRQETCLRLAAWIDLNLMHNLHYERSNSAVVLYKAQNIPQFFEGCCWLAGFRT